LFFKTVPPSIFRPAFEDMFDPDPAELARQQEKERQLQAQSGEAYSFLRAGFDRLAEEQADWLRNATVDDYTITRVKEFETKLSLAYRLLVRQSDTRFGENATNRALENCGFAASHFRFKHKF